MYESWPTLVTKGDALDEEFFFSPPKYSQFTQQVRRYRPSQLLPLLASMSVRDDPNFHGFEDIRQLPPWGTAAIARESVVRGNEYRSGSASEIDVRRMLQLHHEVFVEPARPTFTAIAGPIVYEQSWWQLSLFEEQTRAVSLFDDPTYGVQFDWESALGLPLVDAIRAAFIVGLAVNKNRGRWDPALLDVLYSDPRIESHAPRASVEATARLLTGDLKSLRTAGQGFDNDRDRETDLAKHPLNPLMGQPLVNLGSHGIWAPVAPMTWRALLPAGLYIHGRRAWGNDFTTALGHRYEKYVGALLRNVAPDLTGEVRYGKGGGKASVDWVWTASKAVVLIECKSAGLSIDAISGGGRFSDIVDRAVVHPRRQIDRAAAAIRTNVAGFEQVPKDRPIFGLIVTSDPFPFANAGLEEYGTPGVTPTLVTSVRALEHLTSLPNAMDVLLDVFADEERRTWDLGHALPNVRGRRHPLADKAWAKIGPLAPPP